MGFENKYPYTDFHELNLDWIVGEIYKLHQDYDYFKAINKITFKGNWDITKQYPAWSIVDNNGSGYLSVQAVPAGVNIDNTEYWTLVANYTELFASFQLRLTEVERASGYNFSHCVFLGDSYTETGYLQDSDGFVPKLCNLLGITSFSRYGRSGCGFINQGGSGHGTYLDILNNEIVPAEEGKNVTFLFVEGGTNDGAPEANAYEEIVKTFINRAKQVFPNAKICLMYTPTFSVALGNTLEGMKHACEQTGVYYIDASLWLALNTKYESIDNQNHPTAEGCTVIAQNIKNTLFCNGAEGYCKGDLSLPSDQPEASFTHAKWFLNNDSLTIIINGGITNFTGRYCKIAQLPKYVQNHIARFEGCAYTGLGTPYPIWITEQGISLDTLNNGTKSTDYQLALSLSLKGLCSSVI